MDGNSNIRVYIYIYIWKKKDLELVYPHPLLTLYRPQFILRLSSHQLSRIHYFSCTFPDIVALRKVKQASELHLFNQHKQTRIQWTFLWQRAASRCEGFTTFWKLLSSPSSWCAGGLVAPKQMTGVQLCTIYISDQSRNGTLTLWLVGAVKRPFHLVCAIYCWLCRAFHGLLSLSLLSCTL